MKESNKKPRGQEAWRSNCFDQTSLSLSNLISNLSSYNQSLQLISNATTTTTTSTTLPLQQDFFKQLDFNDFGSQVNKDFVSAITAGLANHGMVVVDNIDLPEDQYLYLTASIGEPIDLPNFLVPAKLPGFPEISRVGNFGSDDGKVIQPMPFDSIGITTVGRKL